MITVIIVEVNNLINNFIVRIIKQQVVVVMVVVQIVCWIQSCDDSVTGWALGNTIVRVIMVVRIVFFAVST